MLGQLLLMVSSGYLVAFLTELLISEEAASRLPGGSISMGVITSLLSNQNPILGGIFGFGGWVFYVWLSKYLRNRANSSR